MDKRKGEGGGLAGAQSVKFYLGGLVHVYTCTPVYM